MAQNANDKVSGVTKDNAIILMCSNIRIISLPFQLCVLKANSNSCDAIAMPMPLLVFWPNMWIRNNDDGQRDWMMCSLCEM